MSISHETKKHLESIASDTLETFEAIATAARAKLSERPASPGDVLVNVNVVTSSNAFREFDRITNANRASFRHLLQEPAIARVVAIEHGGRSRTYLICRTSPVPLPDGETQLASYLSPVGRMASLPIGEDIQLPNGDVLEVVERATLQPVRFGSVRFGSSKNGTRRTPCLKARPTVR